MKKALTLLFMIFFLAGCNGVDKNIVFNTDTSEMYAPEEYEFDYFLMLKKEGQDEVYSNLTYLRDGEVKHLDPDVTWALGIDIPELEFETYDGRLINLADMKGKVYILEFMASWCGHCMAAAKETVGPLVESFPDLEYIQVFIDAEDNQAIEDFYSEVGIDIPTNETLCKFNPLLKPFMIRIGLDSIPTFIVVDKNGKIGMASVGTENNEYMREMVKYVMEHEPIYTYETQENKTLFESIHLSNQ